MRQAARAALAAPSQVSAAEMGKKRCKTPVGTEAKVALNPPGGKAASKKGTGPADGGQIVPVTLEQLKEKIKDLEIQQKRKPENKRQDPVYAEIALLKTPAPVELDEEVALASFMDVIEDVQMNDDEKCTKIRELCARQGAEVQRLEQSCAMMLEACTSLRTRTVEDEVAAYELKQEANKKRDLQSKLQELCRVQTLQVKEAKKRSEEQTKAEEANMQDVATQVQKLMAEIEARALAKKDEIAARIQEKAALEEKLQSMKEQREQSALNFKQTIVDRMGDVDMFEKSIEERRRVLEAEKVITARGQEALDYYKQRSVALEQQKGLYSRNIEDHQTQTKKIEQVKTDVKERLLKMGEWRDELRKENQILREAIDLRIKGQEMANEDVKALKPLLEEALAAKVKLEKGCRQLQVERAQRLAAARDNIRPATKTGAESQEPVESTGPV